MRTEVAFNRHWLFCAGHIADDQPIDQFEAVTLPHSNIILPHHNFDNAEYEFVSTYRKYFELPAALNGRRLYVDFDGAMIAATVSINGHRFEEHRGGYVPFSFDITDCVNEAGQNLLTVHLDSTERKDIPPYGYVVDYLTFGGIYRDVRLRYVEACHITNVLVQARNLLSDRPEINLLAYITNQTGRARQMTIVGCFEDWKFATAEVEIAAGQDTVARLSGDLASFPGEAPTLWSLDDPQLYEFGVDLSARGGKRSLADRITVRSGLREAVFHDDGFYLNGDKINLIGLNRHQTYPYIGAAAPKRLQRKDADIIKYELGCNIVRTSHYPQSPHFLERCDEIGLLVFEEIAGWQHIGDTDWQQLASRDLKAMIERDRNHPSIVLWGVRINESPDDDAFYEETNTLAHELDPTRQTGGVRNFQTSRKLEDVFTFNDFSNSVEMPHNRPHLITEFNGHMFPTKSWDQEERLIEHALRHARIQDRQLGMGNVVGAIGWCAFDYNTHKEFGSGDRVCYHGVMDIFRLAKYAAYFYGSQVSPGERVVLQAATIWSMGDRDGGGNDPLVIFSNCDEIEIFIGQKRIGRYLPDRDSFHDLPHPPFQVKGLGMRWGQDFGDLHLVGYVNGREAASQTIDAGGRPHALILQPDDLHLEADGSDMTRLVFKIVDRYGNRLPYVNQVVTFEIDGPGDLIGENPFALVGGQAALYLRARHEAGVVTVQAQTARLENAEAKVVIREQ